ncbi:ribosome maturation factor RimP [Bombilactobacillus thymidiniphilus]|uniref:Ribosome maturation factor RimP n=1 Tax=Bombilactobacillus thymidiniphilus TaxID=2923363 RepID=A0ABY4PDC4_9LACO|nr:ribosome maturation factor RimP [Bombilactobacillus thymidiniphilus]UQS83496.1 ribosome maturation factor RimP [Bombilactobacillus thymidiniphilus]
MASVTESIEQMVNPILSKYGFYLVEIEYVKEGNSWYLRLYIDKPAGIDIEECSLVNQELSDVLDEQDPDLIPHAYFLEVSSPGAERPIKTERDLQLAKEQFIHVSLYQKLNGQKVFEGTLVDYNAQELILEIKVKTHKQQITIARKSIASMRLAIEF